MKKFKLYCVKYENGIIEIEQIGSFLIIYSIVRVTPNYYQIFGHLDGRHYENKYGDCLASRSSLEAAIDYLGGRSAIQNIEITDGGMISQSSLGDRGS